MMTEERWYDVEYNQANLTQKEINQGWHFCQDWDGMLVGPGMPEFDSCLCCISGVEDSVTIPASEYEKLKEGYSKWYALEVSGVDNWEGYDEAMKIHNEDYSS